MIQRNGKITTYSWIGRINIIYRLHRKYKFPLILSSGAESVYDIRTVHDFMAVFVQTGLNDFEVEKAFETAEEILNFNSNRKNLILTGVRVVE